VARTAKDTGDPCGIGQIPSPAKSNRPRRHPTEKKRIFHGNISVPAEFSHGFRADFFRKSKISENFHWRNSKSRANCHTVVTNPQTNQPTNTTTHMKLFLSALCASLIIAPLSFANECEKGKCDKEKKEGTLLTDCGKCKKEGECDKDKKDSGTLAADCGKCKKEGECDKDKKDSGTLAADCGKCKKDDGCDKDKKDSGTLADCGKCKKDDGCDKDKKAELTLA
jgi:hypothetical protein